MSDLVGQAALLNTDALTRSPVWVGQIDRYGRLLIYYMDNIHWILLVWVGQID